MSSNTHGFRVRLQALGQLGAVALFVAAIVSGCGGGGGGGAAGGGTAGATSGGHAGSTGTASGGKTGAAAGSSSAGSAGTSHGGSSTGGLTGEAGMPEAGAVGMPAALCGDGHVDPGEECDDGNTKDGDGCSSICTSKCETCETAAKCATDPNSDSANNFKLCYGTGPQATAPAAGGPAAGIARNQLCQELVACLRKSNCAAQDVDRPFGPCYCGAADQDNCIGTDGKLGAAATGPKGPCVDELARAAESRTYADIVAKLGPTGNNAAAAAMSIIFDCDAAACPRQCFQDKDPSACEKCAIGPTPLGYQYMCPDYLGCYFSTSASVQDAAGMPKTLPLAKLCAPAADCALRTGCATKGVASCYGNGSGPCAAEFAAAADSTDPATVTARLESGRGYPSGTAASLLTCEATSCKADCFPSPSGGAGGSAGTGGASAGTGGASAGTSGASAGTGGASAGTGGASAGTGGASAGTGGASAGTGGASAGTGGASAGTGGASMGGTGGASAGTSGGGIGGA